MTTLSGTTGSRSSTTQNNELRFRTCFSGMMCVSGSRRGKSTKSTANSPSAREAAAAADRRHANDPDPDGGFASAICRRPAHQHRGRFVEPILRHHDREAFETHCYFQPARSATARPSALRRHFDHWRDVHALSDGYNGGDDPVRTGIDVLVDLCGHGREQNTPPARASRHGSGQLSGYSTTTGLASMDYALTTEYSIRAVRGPVLFTRNSIAWAEPTGPTNPSVTLPASPVPLKATAR